ncbi:MAG: hypothetical protein ACOX4F_00525 [Atopobiaceae bacterium]
MAQDINLTNLTSGQMLLGNLSVTPGQGDSSLKDPALVDNEYQRYTGEVLTAKVHVDTTQTTDTQAKRLSVKIDSDGGVQRNGLHPALTFQSQLLFRV